MSTASIVLIILGILFLIESLVALFFTDWTIKFGRKMMNNKKVVKKLALSELIIAVILLLVGMNI